MSASLNRKINRSKGRYRNKQALTKSELKTLLAWLREDRSIKGLENFAIVLMLVTSGLRASELCQLNWESLYREDGRVIASFIGKGGRAAEQELYPDTVEAADTYFQAQFRRAPDPCDWLFYTLENFHGRQPSPLAPSTIWARIHELGRAVHEAHLVRGDLQFSPHLFRKTFATLYYKQTRDIKSTQLATRHSSVAVLLKHYVDSAHGISDTIAQILA
jgi:integrase